MLSEQDINELRSMSDEELLAVVRTMRRQVEAKFFIGDRNRSRAVRDAAQAELGHRETAKQVRWAMKHHLFCDAREVLSRSVLPDALYAAMLAEIEASQTESNAKGGKSVEPNQS